MNASTIKLFLPQGDPNGLRTAEVSNWSGKAIAAPRSSFKDFLQRDELENSGVYFLLGSDPESGATMAYIGEGECIKERIRTHIELYHASITKSFPVVALLSGALTFL